MRRLALLLLLVLAGVPLASCASPNGDQGFPTTQTTEGSEEGGPPINWESPLSDGVELPSTAAAQILLTFNAVAPRFGEPVLIQVDDPSLVSPAEATLAFVFHLESYGTVLVEERAQGDWTVDQMKARADDPNAPADAFQIVFGPEYDRPTHPRGRGWAHHVDREPDPVQHNGTNGHTQTGPGPRVSPVATLAVSPGSSRQGVRIRTASVALHAGAGSISPPPGTVGGPSRPRTSPIDTPRSAGLKGYTLSDPRLNGSTSEGA